LHGETTLITDLLSTMRRSNVFVLAIAAGALAVAPSGPWDDFNFAPASRTVYPAAIYGTSGDVDGAEVLIGSDSEEFATIGSKDSFVTLDFGLEVGRLRCFSMLMLMN
jgi:hypothetical protein